jgi:hypothetical protein
MTGNADPPEIFMRMSSLRAAERRIALAALVMLSATAAMAQSAHAATYSATVLAESPAPLTYYKLDEPVGASTAVNSAPALGSSADGAYRNSVRNARPPAITCEGREKWLDAPAGAPSHVSTACQTRGDARGFSAYFSGAPYNPQVAVSQVQESLSYTLEAWVKPAGAGSSGGIVDHGDNGVLSLEAGKVTFIAHATDGNAVATQPLALSPGVWHHVFGSWNNLTGTAKLYVDGALADSDIANPLDPGAANGAPSLYVGWTNQDGAGSFTGDIDNVAYYPAAIDVSPHYALGLGGGGGPRVVNMIPENGSAFSTASTKWASTLFAFTCSVSCTYDILGPLGTHYLGGPTASFSGPLPNGDGPGTYRITITAPGGPPSVSTYKVGSFTDVISADAPTAWWRFNEADGIGIAADSAPGNLYPGAYQNPSSNGGIGISGDANAARKFLDGDGGYVGINGVDAKTQSYTIELWFKTSDAGDMALFDHGAHGGGPALYLEGSSIKYRTVDGQILSTGYASGAWTHVAATWDGVTATLYKDGLSGASTTSTLSPSGTPALYLGFANVGLTRPAFRGLMDEASYYGSALSANHVYDHYLADPPAPTRAGTHSADSEAAASPAAPASQSSAVALGKRAVAAKAKALARKRAAARKRAQAKALAKARARAKARAKAKALARVKAHARAGHRRA